MRLIPVTLFILASDCLRLHASQACPPGYIDCGRGVCCPQ